MIGEDDDVDEVVHPVDLVRDRRDGFLECDLFGRGLARAGQRGQARKSRNQSGEEAGAESCRPDSESSSGLLLASGARPCQHARHAMTAASGTRAAHSACEPPVVPHRRGLAPILVQELPFIHQTQWPIPLKAASLRHKVALARRRAGEPRTAASHARDFLCAPAGCGSHFGRIHRRQQSLHPGSRKPDRQALPRPLANSPSTELGGATRLRI